MAFVVSSLPDYSEINREQIIKKAVLGGKFIERMTKQTGIKKDALLNYLAVSPVLQSGASCGFNASGDTTFTQRTLSTADIKVNMSWCTKTLVGKWNEYQVRIAANPNAETLPFWDEILEQLLAELNKKRENLIWNGDITSSDADIKWHNGLIKLALADSTVIDVTVAAGSSYIKAVKDVYLAIPAEVLDKAQIFVNPSFFRALSVELAEKSGAYFRAEDADPEVLYIPGIACPVVKVNGIGSSNYIFAADPAELFFGCDLENGAEDARLWYSDDDDLFKLKINWNQGVQYAFGDHIVLGAYSTLTSPDADGALAELASANHVFKTQEQGS